MKHIPVRSGDETTVAIVDDADLFENELEAATAAQAVRDGASPSDYARYKRKAR